MYFCRVAEIVTSLTTSRNTPFSHLLKTFLFASNFYVRKALETLLVMFALSLHYKSSDNICNNKYIGCFSPIFNLCCDIKVFYKCLFTNNRYKKKTIKKDSLN